MSNQYGRKRVIVVGHIISLIGAIIGVIVQQVYIVMIGLIIAGLGSGGQAQAVAVLSETVMNRNRGWAQGKHFFFSSFRIISAHPGAAAKNN
jgi:MFS family permease